MAKNEAKIKFTAETGSFNDAIKKSNDEMSKLRAELKLNETQMKATGNTVEGLEEKQKLLGNQLKATQDKTEAISQKLEVAKKYFGENSTEVNKLETQLAKAQTEEERLKQALSACNTELKQQKAAASQAETATAQLTDKIDKQETELSQLKNEYVEAVLQYGKNSKEAKTLAKEIDSLSGELSANKKELDNAKTAADKLDKSLDDVGDGAADVGGKFEKAAVGIAALGTAAIAAGKECIEAFNEVDEGADNVIKATGATGEAAVELQQNYKNVASSVVGSFDDIGSTVGEVNTRFGYTGTKLEECATDFLKFAEITGVDSTEAVKSVTRALNDAGIPLDDYGTLLDQLAKAGQSAGIDVTTLTDSLSKNGSIMRSMGFDTSETIALLSQFELSGADASTMLTGMKKAMATWADAGKDGTKEFGVLVSGIKDGSVTAADAIDVFGTKAGPMLVDAIKSGKFEYNDMLSVIQGSKGTMDGTFDELVDGGYNADLALQNAKLAASEAGEGILTTFAPAIEKGAKALATFSKGISTAFSWMSEHKGTVTVIASAIGILTTAIIAYNVVQGIKNAMDAANVTTVWALVAAHWAQATAAMAAIAPYVLIVAAIAAVIAIIVLCVKHWDKIVEAVKKCWETIKNTLSKWGTWINENVIQPVVNFFKGLWDSIVNIFKSIIDWVKNNWKSIVLFFINPFAGVFNYLYENFEGFRNFINNIVTAIKNFFVDMWNGIKQVWDWICNAVQVAIMFIGSIISAAVEIITLPFRFIWENCKQYVFAAWEWIKNAISTAVNAVKNVITTVFNAVKNFFSTVWNGIKNVFTTVWNAIVNFVTPIVNKIKSVITTAFNKVKSTVTTIFNAVKNVVTSVWNGIKNAISTAVNAVKSKVTSIFNSVKSTVSNVFNGIKNTATNVWNGIKNAITKPIEAARDKVKGIIDKIKGFFSGLKLKLPKIKLPHFKVEGKLSLSPPSVPKLKIDWYKDGGIMTRPTIFGFNGNSLMAGGEAGAEAILPISKLEEYISGTIEKTMNVVNLDTLAAAVEDLANRPNKLYINGREFATATASDTDSVGGLRNAFKSRGLIVE